MSKQKMKDKESVIVQMREAGKSRQEIADELGLAKAQIKGRVTRYNKHQRETAISIPRLPTGRPRKDYALTEENKVAYYKRPLRLARPENKRLEMENKLMRDFLQSTGRK